MQRGQISLHLHQESFSTRRWQDTTRWKDLRLSVLPASIQTTTWFPESSSRMQSASRPTHPTPEVGHNILKYDKVEHMFPVPFVLYADFESCATPSGKHEFNGFCCLRVSKFPQHDHNIYTYYGDNVLQQFSVHVQNEQTTINNILSTDHPMDPLTDEEARAHDAATVCFTCLRHCTTANVKTRHHCYSSGKYIAPVCNNCNLQLKHRKRNDKYSTSTLSLYIMRDRTLLISSSKTFTVPLQRFRSFPQTPKNF